MGLRAVLLTTCVCLIEFSLSYFVFQVADFRHRIIARDFKQLLRNLKTLNAVRVIILTVLLLTGVEKVVIEYIFVTKTGEDIMATYSILMSTLLIIRIFASLSTLLLFLQCLIFFVKGKMKKLKHRSLSALNRAVITLVVVLMCDRFAHYILINGFSVGIV